MSRFASLLVVVLAPMPSLAADILVRDRGSFNAAMQSVKPGDRVLLAPGDYAGNFFFREVHGANRRPIVIAAADANRPPRFIGPNIGLQLSGCSYLELYDLEFTGTDNNALNIDDGGKPESPSHHIIIRNVKVRDIRKRGNVDGIKLSGIDDFLIADCTISGWGSGGSGIDMVGCHRGVVTRCTFRDGGANGLQMKGGSASIVVRGCRFENAGERALQIGGSTGDPHFRPPLKDMPENAKYEAKEIRVEGNTFVGGDAAIAFVNADGSIVRFNTIVRPDRYAIRILQERTEPEFIPCRKGIVEDNLITFRTDRWAGVGVNVGAGTDPMSFAFTRNLWFCEDRPERSAPRLIGKEIDGIYGKDPLFRDPTKGDFGVKPSSPAAKFGAHALPEVSK